MVVVPFEFDAEPVATLSDGLAGGGLATFDAEPVDIADNGSTVAVVVVLSTTYCSFPGARDNCQL